LNEQKGKFVLNKPGIKAMLQSQEVQEMLKREGEKRGEVTEEFVGTQRAWVKVKEND